MDIESKVDETPTRSTEPTARRRGALGLIALLTPVWITAILGGYFFYQARFDQSFRYYPFPWRAHWITSPYKSTCTACYRKVLETSGPTKIAYLAIAADNFYTLKVNDNTITPFFHPSDYRTWVKDQAIYVGMGYGRHTDYARIYDIQPFLREGRNVITVMVQSDQGTPLLAVQGAIINAFRQDFYTDATWTVAPVERRDETLTWTSPYYEDVDWAHAIVTPERVDALANGDYAVLDTPLQGCFIGSAGDRLSDEARISRDFTLPDKVTEGWLRLSTLSNYDLLINDRFIGSTVMQGRYDGISLLSKRGDFDALSRDEFRPATHSYPRTTMVSHLDVYMLKNVLKKGDNHIEVRLRPNEIEEIRRLPTCYLDAQMHLGDGSTRSLHTDGTWQAADSSTQFSPAPARVVSSVSQDTYMHLVTDRIYDKVDAGSERGFRLARNEILLTLGSTCALFLFVWTTERKDPERRQKRFKRMSAIFIPSAVILTSCYVLQELFLSSTQDEYFHSSRFAWFALALCGAAILCLSIGAYLIMRWQSARGPEPTNGPERPAPSWRAALNRYGFAAAVGAIMIVALVIYQRGVGNEAYLADEYVSMLAAHGILRRGIPIYLNTGIVYTRSSLFHYILAFFMAVGGEKNVIAVRLVSALWGVATIPLVYLFGREVQGRWTGLIAAALIAFSPYWIYYSREVRFYTQFGFFTTLTFYLLLQSIRNPDNVRYRIGVVLAFCAGYLSQQFMIAVVPTVFLVVILSGQLRLWFRRGMLLWLAFAFIIMVIDLVAYLKWCQTPLPFVDQESVLLLSLHTDIMDVLPGMLLSNVERTQALLGLLYLGGLFAFLLRLLRAPRNESEPHIAPGWTWWSYIYLITTLTVVVSTIVSPRPTTRYIVHMAPLLAITAACVAVHAGMAIYRWLRETMGSVTAARLFQSTYLACMAVVCVAPFRPLRVWHATERQTNRDATEASRFIIDHQRPGDKVMYFSPEIAMVELGRCDYMWRPRRGSVFKYMDSEGRLAERNSHAIVIDNVDKLRRIMTDSKRIWLVIQTQSLNGASEGLDGELNRFVNDNFQVVDEPLSAAALLWDQGWHHYRNSARDYGFDQFNF